jgi:signal transduction histidine kinase
MKLTESERGCFVSAHAEGLELRFLGAVNTEGTFSVISRGEVEGGYPEGILNYALRTSETLFYEHLELEGFRFDPYIKEREPETVLCMPIHTYGEIKTLLYLENGKNIGSLATPVRELTESIAVQAALTIESGRLYERERELEHQNREQLLHLMEAEKSASIGFLIAEIAHEVNNPNQAISLNADTLSNLWADTAPVLTEYAKEEDFAIGNLSYTDFREEYPKIIKAIRVSSRQIHYLVQELRAFMQPKRSIELRKMDVNAILRSTILIASHFINQATERFSFEEGCLPKILCDDRRLQQVFLNLIRNSCQSLTDTGKAIKIVSRLHEKEETVEIVVEDEGCGMEASQLQKIGEPFFTSRSDQEGTGLGLYVSKAILREHGGHMKVESREGEGTKVSVILPVCER